MATSSPILPWIAGTVILLSICPLSHTDLWDFRELLVVCVLRSVSPMIADWLSINTVQGAHRGTSIQYLIPAQQAAHVCALRRITVTPPGSHLYAREKGSSALQRYLISDFDLHPSADL
jgi:hypothetical protein